MVPPAIQHKDTELATVGPRGGSRYGAVNAYRGAGDYGAAAYGGYGGASYGGYGGYGAY